MNVKKWLRGLCAAVLCAVSSLRRFFFASLSLFLRLRLAAPISCGCAPPFEGLNALFFADLGRRARTTVIFYYFCTK